MYGKIFASMYEGSMVGAGPLVFAVWGYCIAKADVDGTVLLNPALLAPVIGTTPEDIQRALEYLQEPDEHSKNPDHDGRRLLHQSGHLFFVVSHEIYRGMKSNEDRREYMREYMRKKRGGDAVNSLQVNTELTKVNPASASVFVSALQGGCKGDGFNTRSTHVDPKPKTYKQWGFDDLLASVRENNTDHLLTEDQARDFAEFWTSEKDAAGKSRLAKQKTWSTRMRMKTAKNMIYGDNRFKGNPVPGATGARRMTELEALRAAKAPCESENPEDWKMV
jgi:hypothetical protein